MPETTQFDDTQLDATQLNTTQLNTTPFDKSKLATANYPDDNPRIEEWMIRAAQKPLRGHREWWDANPGLVRLIIDNEYVRWEQVESYKRPPETTRKLGEMTEEERYQFRRKNMEDIGLGKIPCPMCRGQESAGRVWANHKGLVTGTRARLQQRCECAWLRMYSRLRAKHIPPAYRWVDLDRLKPYTKSGKAPSAKQQEANIEFLRANPELSYLFLGPPGIGKTVYEFALIDRALYDYSIWRFNNPYQSVEGVWVLNTREFLDQCQAWATGKDVAVTDDNGVTRIESPPPPELTKEKIKAAKEKDWTPRIFLLELDKFGIATKTRLGHLFNIMEAAQSYESQMVADTNYKIPQLHQYLEGQDGDGYSAEVFTRRFLQADGRGQHWDFFKGKFGDVPK